MKKYPFVIMTTVVLLAAVLLFFLRGQIKPVDDLLRPPQEYDSQASVKQTLENAIGEKVSFLTVKNDVISSTTFYEDMGLTGLLSSEFVVFYSVESSSDAVSFAVMKKISNEYTLLYNCRTKFSNAEKVCFYDIDNDGKTEMILGLNSYDSAASQTLFVYDFENKSNEFSCNEIYEHPYGVFKVCDVDHDGTKDIVIVSTVSSSRLYENEVSFVSFSGQKPAQSKAVRLDASMDFPSDISFDYSKQDKTSRIFVDGYTSDGYVITDLFLCKKGTDTLDKFSEFSVSGISKRSINIGCKDIDGDSMIEIPCTSTDSAVEQSDAHILLWKSVTSDGLTTKMKMLENRQKGYCFAIGNKLDKLCNVSVKNGGTSLTFLSKTDNSFVFEIVAFDNSKDFDVPTDYELLATEREYDYYCYISETGEKAGISFNDLKKSMLFEPEQGE